MANRRFIDFPIASSVGENDIILIWQSGANKQTTKGTLLTGIATELENLTDVQITSLANGQILEYDSVIGKWKNVAKSDTDLSDLGDVSIVSPVTGQVLVYNATTGNWENSSAGLVPYVGAVTTVNLGNQQLIAGKTTITSNGGDDTLIVNHTSGSGIALDIAKGGNGEGLRVVKSSGSGNAMSITGGNLGAEAAAFSGVVTTTPDAVINAVNFGRGGGDFTSNTRAGANALQSNTTGQQNTAVGTQVLLSNTSASFNTGLGYNALLRNTTGGQNTAVGTQSLYENTIGNNNTSVGFLSLHENTTGSSNSSFGTYALENNTTGLNNTAVGQQALENNTTGDTNTAIGFQALRYNTGNGANTAVGNLSSWNNTGAFNTSVGNASLFGNTTGTYNVGIGVSSMKNNTTGSYNIAIGDQSGQFISAGGDNVISNNSLFIGTQTRALANDQTNQIVIGHTAIGNGSNTVTIGNTSITDNYFTGNVRGGAFIKTGGTSSEFLKADGSVDSNTYVTGGPFLPLTGGTLTGALNGTSASFTGTLGVTGAATFSSSVTANGLYANAGNSARFYRGANDFYWSINNDSNNFLNFGTFEANGTAYGSNPKMILQDDGKVGIGTDTPAFPLDVETGSGRIQLRTGAATGGTGGGNGIASVNSANNALSDLNIRANIITLITDSTERMRITSGGVVQPGADNTQTLGSASFRWSEVFAGNATINTSDATEKQDIEELNEAEQKVAKALKGLIRKYRWIDSVKRKGDEARIHVGVMAQDVAQAFTDNGLDAERYGVFCKDVWYTKEETYTEQIDNPDFDKELEEGEGNLRTIQGDEKIRTVNCNKEDLDATEHTLMGVRYDQLWAFIISAL